VFGPATAASFEEWAGVKPPVGKTTFADLAASITPVRTPIGDAWILEEDASALSRSAADGNRSVRLLPSGDTFFMLWGAARTLLVPDAGRRSQLWTPRVWPGALLIGHEIAGTWRRAGGVVTVEPWRRLTAAERLAVEEETAAMPLPGLDGPIVVRWPG